MWLGEVGGGGWGGREREVNWDLQVTECLIGSVSRLKKLHNNANTMKEQYNHADMGSCIQ